MYFLIGLIKSTALYGIFSLLICTFGLHMNIHSLYQTVFHISYLQSFIQTPISVAKIPSLFLIYICWSPVVYIAAIIIHFLYTILRNLIKGDHYDYLENTMGRFIGAFTNPWRGLVALIGANQTIDSDDFFGLYCWFEVILHFCWSIALFAFLIMGFYSLVK